MTSTLRLLWREFRNPGPATSELDVSRPEMLAVLAVLLLRIVLWWLIVTPFVPVVIVRMMDG